MLRRHSAAALSMIGLALLPMNSIASALKAQIFRMPEQVETSAVTTAGHYILASHLVRPLTKIDKFGKIQADIAVKWVASADHKTWTITLAPARFSDGSSLTAKHVAASIARQRKLGTGVHFPFGEITALKVNSDTEIEVTLKHTRNDFIYDLSKPEFGVLSPADAAAEKDKGTFKVTSGAYSLESRSDQGFRLKRNPHFTADARNDLDLVIENSNGATSPTALTSGSISFFTTQASLDDSSHASLASAPGISAEKPHVAFSYWLSLNPNAPYFTERSNRAALQEYVRAFHHAEMEGHSWEKADQLYLPDGDGRPTADQLRKAWSGIGKHATNLKISTANPRLRVVPLKVSNSLLEALLAHLRLRYQIELIPYTTEEQLVAILKANNFDLKISSNDFSSIDLSENLKTTFNASRPYVFLNHGSPIPGWMQKAAETSDKAAQSKIFRDIAVELLDQGLVAPLAYQRVWFYYDKRIDLSAWSKIFPEISFWKVKVGNGH